MWKKFLAIAIALLLLLTTSNIVFAANDVTPLKLKSASINMKEAAIGDTIVLRFVMYPDLESGPIEDPGYTSIRLQHSSGNGIDTMLNYIGNNTYELRYKLDSSMLRGSWHVDYIQVSDNAKNSSYFDTTNPIISSITFNVKNGVTDAQPPVLNGFTLLTPNAKAGEEVKIKLPLTEPNGPVQGRVIFMHTKSDGVINESITLNTATNQYECNFVLPADVRNGEWKFSYLTLRDKHGNEQHYRADDYSYLSNVTLNVSGGTGDYENPILKSIELKTPSVYGGDYLKAVIEAEDVGSGIQRVTISFIHNETGQSFWDEMKLNQTDGKYYLDYRVGLDQISGEYSIEDIILTDNVGNTVFIYPQEDEGKYPKLTINSLFIGVDPTSIIKGSSFDAMAGISAYSPLEGDRTNDIEIQGEVNTNENGVYLLKYGVQSNSVPYKYESYRWVSVNEEQTFIPDPNTEYFNSDVEVGLPEDGNVSLSTGTNTQVLQDDVHLSQEGSYQLSLPGQATQARAFAVKMNKSFKFVIDKTVPSAPTIDAFTTNSTKVSGKTEPNAKVILHLNGKYVRSVKSDSKGLYAFIIAKQPLNTEIKVSVMDAAGNTGKPSVKKVEFAPIVNAVSNLSTFVAGKTVPYAPVKIYSNNVYLTSGKANSTGYYKVTISKQAAGKVIKVTSVDKNNKPTVVYTKVIDQIAPSMPIVNKVTTLSTSITGKGERGARAVIYAGTRHLTTIIVPSTGLFKANIAKQKKGTVIQVWLLDAANNKSAVKSLKVE
ncbi:Ig-like domain-containing protein [Peribacillus alkalitolerans]|uniref:Ig-like domain-containing protein n=1 Tax=Peribacillus alkalitolerans TaxID=1550385 RepID=UPI0013D8C72A|nr:Ig-like domain-containing protein [Peribacillus alkalitolerans]